MKKWILFLILLPLLNSCASFDDYPVTQEVEQPVPAETESGFFASLGALFDGGTQQASRRVPDWVTHSEDTRDALYEVVFLSSSFDLERDKRRLKSLALEKLNKRLEQAYQEKHQVSLAQSGRFSRFEASLRKQAREKAPSFLLAQIERVDYHQDELRRTLYARIKINKLTMGRQLIRKIVRLDQKLANSVLELSGNRYQQLVAFMPLLPIMEQRRAYKAQLESYMQRPVLLPKDNVVRLMDRQFHNIMANLVVNLIPTSQSAAAYERRLAEALLVHGFRDRAYKPDIWVQYDLESQLLSKELASKSEIRLAGQIQLSLGRSQKVAQLRPDITQSGASEYLAQTQAANQVAEDIARALFVHLVKRMYAVSTKPL